MCLVIACVCCRPAYAGRVCRSSGLSAAGVNTFRGYQRAAVLRALVEPVRGVTAVTALPGARLHPPSEASRPSGTVILGQAMPCAAVIVPFNAVLRRTEKAASKNTRRLPALRLRHLSRFPRRQSESKRRL